VTGRTSDSHRRTTAAFMPELHLQHVVVGLAHPPTRVGPEDIEPLQERLPPFEQAIVIPDGVVFANPNLNDLQVHVQITQVNDTRCEDIVALSNTTRALYETVVHYFHIGAFIGFGVKLTAHAEVGDAQEFIRRRYLQRFDPTEVLGGQLDATGLRLVFHQGQHIYNLVVEPLLVDKSRLFVELDVQYGAIASTDEIALRLEQQHQYLFDRVHAFLRLDA
jgi:hypothetical protein